MLRTALQWHRDGRFAEAEAAYRAILREEPAAAVAANNLGVLLLARNELGPAAALFAQAIAHTADYAEAHNNAGIVHLRQARPHDACVCFERALRINPAYTEARTNLARALNNVGLECQEDGALAAAIAHLQRAQACDPQCVDLLRNLGLAHAEAGDHAAALQYLDRALAIAPDDAQLHCDKGRLLHWQLGQFPQAWEEMEWRLQLPVYQYVQAYCQSRWNGHALAGQRLLVHTEQGLSDELIYSSLLHDVLAAGAQCIVECEPRLAGLLQRGFPAAQVHARNTADIRQSVLAADRTIDAQIPLCSLARHFRRSTADFARHHRHHLAADARRVAAWRERLAALPAGPRIGISWRSGSAAGGIAVGDNMRMARHRVTALADWREVLTVPGVAWINLQYGDVRDELAQAWCETGVVIHDWDDLDQTHDIEALAAVVANLDLVISVNSFAAFLGARLGKPTWCLVSYAFGSAWPLEHPCNTWVPTLRFIRQPAPGDWAGALRHVASKLVGF